MCQIRLIDDGEMKLEDYPLNLDHGSDEDDESEDEEEVSVPLLRP
jgi:hypothetical protein